MGDNAMSDITDIMNAVKFNSPITFPQALAVLGKVPDHAIKGKNALLIELIGQGYLSHDVDTDVLSLTEKGACFSE